MNKSWRNVVIGDETGKPEVEKKPVSSGPVNANVSSTSVNSSASASSVSPKIPVAAENDKKRYERLLVVYAPLVGSRVTVFLYDGAVFEGTLDSFETNNEFALILRMSTMIRPGREVIDPSIKAGVTFELMNIRFDDMAELKGAASKSSSGGIGTDAAISKKKGDFGKERELHRWLPEETAMVSSLNSETCGQWDQFATNEKLFGLKTDFNEELYTTKLDRNSATVRANEANAERIAKEIMKASAGGNVHLAEERGQEQEGEVDEEMLYGAVVRESASGTLPPGFAKNSEKDQSTSTTANASKSTLNPSAPEFKLNIDAPEFNPSAAASKVTYYNQPRRNLNYGGYGTGYGQGNGNGNGYYQQVAPYGYPQGVPYYYVPPQDHVPMQHAAPMQPFAPMQPVAPMQSTAPTVTTTATTTMNPNAADFVMPSASAAAPYYMPSNNYYYGQPTGYYYNNNNNSYDNNYNNNQNNNKTQ